MKLKNLSLLVLIAFSAVSHAAEVSGDLRYRVERIDEDGKDSRLRDRVRARVQVKGDVDEHFKYGVRLASGSTDPVSTNQTLDGAFSTKAINLDLAYIHYHCPVTSADVHLGKMKNSFKKPGKSSLLWDSDLNPEGMAIGYKKYGAFVNVARYWLDEKSGSSDAMLHGAQLGYKRAMGSIEVMVGASYFDYVGIKNQTTLVDGTDSFGNSATANKYDNDYNLTEGFLEVKSLHHPVTVYFDYVNNGEANNNNTGWLAGLMIGKKTSFHYNYRNLEKDATIGAFTDSDFKGGGTDGKGHSFSVARKLTKKSKLSLTHFFNKTAITNGKDYHRSQLDFSLKF